MDIKQFEKLVNRYLAGSATHLEKQAIDRWLDQQAQPDLKINDADRIRLENEMLAHFRQHRQALIPKQTLIVRIKPHLRIAAVLAILISGFYIFRSTVKDHPTIDQTLNNAYQSYQTPNGEKVTLIMPDGSKIWLNSASRLRYPIKFNGNTREVFLEEGEAFFEIKHEAKKPFIVHSGNLDTRVLGTSFNISNEQDRQKISVNTGKVSVTKVIGKNKQVLAVMTPDQGIVVDTHSGIYKQINSGTLQNNAWKDNILIFRDAQFDEVKLKLEKWYNVKITLSHTGKYCLFTARLNNKSLTETLKALQQINAFTYHLEGTQLSINNNQCK
jgi:ferric-dicitrate binding protein FerR (iron transport regulator)